MNYTTRCLALMLLGLFIATFQTPNVFAQTDSAPRLLIPLYSYPNWYDPENYIWDEVAEAGSRAALTVIINPANGAGGGAPNADYQQGLATLRDAGVTILGYVYTGYGERNIEDVKAEIDLYHQFFEAQGIFFDEVANSADKLPYYENLYSYVKVPNGSDLVFLNPGTSIDEAYLAVADTIVIFEGYAENWPGYSPDVYLCDYPAGRFGALLHSAPDADAVESYLALAVEQNIAYLYVTDDLMPNPWDSLPGFWEDLLLALERVRQQSACGGGTTPPGGEAAPSHVPEPSTFLLLGLGFLSFIALLTAKKLAKHFHER